MDLGQIVSDSFKFPFKDLKHSSILFLLFALLLIFPLGLYLDNETIVIAGLISLLIFYLIKPGYMILVVKEGIDRSSEVPTIKIGKSIVNTLKLILTRICYIFIPTVIVFLILLFATGLLDFPMRIADSIVNLTFSFSLIDEMFQSLEIIVVGTAVVSWLFSLLYCIAKARWANTNSVAEALKIHKVGGDIRKIGIGKFIGWYIVMGIIVAFIKIFALFVMFIPYTGFVIYLCILCPVLDLIYYNSLGLLYSEFSNGSDNNDNFDLDEFEREIQRLKYLS